MIATNPAIKLASDNVAALDGASVRPIKESVGSYISGYRFDGKSISDGFREAMRDLLHNRGLVVFEPGTVTAENFTVFGGVLGEFFHYAGPHTPRAPENPDATVISASKDAHLCNHVWHADGGFRADAPAFTALFAKAIPDDGGDTMFANSAWVYESLDPLFAQYLDSLNVIQSPDATGHITDRYLDAEEAAQARLRCLPLKCRWFAPTRSPAASG
jgi:taurine dioxygenase